MPLSLRLLQCIRTMSPYRSITARCAPVLVLALLCAVSLGAQAPVRTNGAAQSGVYLVFPFENAGASPRLDWLAEGLEELTIQPLSASGQQVYSNAGPPTHVERNVVHFSANLSRARRLH